MSSITRHNMKLKKYELQLLTENGISVFVKSYNERFFNVLGYELCEENPRFSEFISTRTELEKFLNFINRSFK